MMLSSLSSVAQKHLTFMGVPLDGTISTFQKKIADKGVSYNPKLSKIFPVGCRAFDGIFAGHKAEIIVYYDNKSKIVYRAKAVYTETSEEYCNQLYDEIKNSLSQKYDGEETDSEISNEEGIDRPVFRVYPSDDFGTKYGEIDLYQQRDAVNLIYPNYYSLHIDYIDLKNYFDHQDKVADDL